MSVRIGVFGSGGRMGRAIIRAIKEHNGAELTLALEREGSPLLGQDAGVLAGLGELDVTLSDNPALARDACDAVIDFTTPDASIALASVLAGSSCAQIIGTTGWSPDQEAHIEAASNQLTIVKSGNMSLGVNLLATLIEQAAKALPETFDIEVLEMHHRMKVDAPSGTALLLGDAAARGRHVELADKSVTVRDGITGERETGTIGFATLRGGTVIGDHSVIFAGPGERITFSHSAGDRSLFAQGAVTAAIWSKGKANALYSMRDVLGI